MAKKENYLVGYALKWNNLSVPLRVKGELCREEFSKGAFTETLKNDEQFCFGFHDYTIVYGRKGAGTLKLIQDDIGLRFEVRLPNTSHGESMFESVKRGDVKGVSVGFRVKKDRWVKIPYSVKRRIVEKATLLEVSLVPRPAYPSSTVQAFTEEEYMIYKRKQLFREASGYDSTEKRQLELERRRHLISEYI